MEQPPEEEVVKEDVLGLTDVGIDFGKMTLDFLVGVTTKNAKKD